MESSFEMELSWILYCFSVFRCLLSIGKFPRPGSRAPVLIDSDLFILFAAGRRPVSRGPRLQQQRVAPTGIARRSSLLIHPFRSTEPRCLCLSIHALPSPGWKSPRVWDVWGEKPTWYNGEYRHYSYNIPRTARRADHSCWRTNYSVCNRIRFYNKSLLVDTILTNIIICVLN